MNQDELLQALRQELETLVQIRFERVVIDRLCEMVQEEPEAAEWIEGLREGYHHDAD